MRILIIAAMQKEINLLLNILEKPDEKRAKDSKIWYGKLHNHEIYLAQCGIGKVNSAVNTLTLITEINPEMVINSGVAGGAGCPVGTVLVADRVAYHDVWCGPGTLYGQADGLPLFMEPDKKILMLAEKMKVVNGLICSGDKFISTPEEIKYIRSKFPDVKAVDMESGSIAQVCLMTGVPFAILRIVSDTPGEGENISQYKDFWSKAPEKTFSILSEILEKI